jgi:hypothetical protein
MKLIKLLAAGAQTVTGDVLFSHPTRGQVLLAHWAGGDECTLTPTGELLLDEILEPKKRAPRAPKAEE